jgi:hypothetical protein
MLVERCASCHNDDKQESDLVLTTYAGVMRGGESGRVVVAGNTDLSELLRRIELPHDDEEFMPAEGKTPLTAEQVEIIRWWIAAGAPGSGTVGTLEVPDDMRETLSTELGVSFLRPALPRAAGWLRPPPLLREPPPLDSPPRELPPELPRELPPLSLLRCAWLMPPPLRSRLAGAAARCGLAAVAALRADSRGIPVDSCRARCAGAERYISAT